MAIKDDLDRLIANGNILHRFVRGNADETVQTEGGPIPTLANVAKRASEQLAALFHAQSTSGVTIGMGVKNFTIDLNK